MVTDPEEPPPRRATRFSIRELLYLTACLIIGLAVGTGGGSAEMDWSVASLTLATLSIATELLGQAAAVRSLPGYATARLFRYAVSAGMAVCVIVRLAEQLGWLIRAEREQAISLLLWDQPFPDAIWYALLAAGASTLCRRGEWTERSQVWPGLGISTALAACTVLYIAVSVSEFSFLPYLVHIATAGIEAAQPLAWHRPGAFPSHAREGFFTYRTVTAAAGLLVFAAGLVGLIARSRRPAFRLALGTIFVIVWAALAGFSWWYFQVELPRISPDLAPAGWAFTAWNAIGGTTLLLVAAMWAASLFTREGIDKTVWGLRPLGVLPIWLAAVGLVLGGGVPATLFVIEMLSDLSQYFAATPSGRLLEALRGILLSPWFLMQAALAASGLQLVCFAWRGRETPISRLPARRTASTVAMFFLLGLVAIPTLAAYSFGSWLGPWWE